MLFLDQDFYLITIYLKNIRTYQLIKKKIFHYSILLPLNYHTLAGIRHIFLDKFPNYLNTKFLTRSSLALFFTTITSSFYLEKYCYNIINDK